MCSSRPKPASAYHSSPSMNAFICCGFEMLIFASVSVLLIWTPFLKGCFPKRIRLAVDNWQLFFPVKLWSNHFSIGAIVIVPPLSLSFSSSHQIKDKVIDYWLVLGRQHSKKGEGGGRLIKYYFNHQQKGNKIKRKSFRLVSSLSR